MQTLQRIILLTIVLSVIFTGCNVQSKYKVRSFQTDAERQAIENMYNPPDKKTEDRVIEPFLENVTGPVIRVNGLDIDSSDLRTLYEYFASFQNDEAITLKRKTASVLIETYAVMSQWPETIQPTLDRMAEIRHKVLEGADFRYLVVENSQEPGAASSGGDLGTISRGMMVPVFEMHVFKDPVGEVIGPFPTIFGWHMLEISERNTDDPNNPSAKARHLLLFHGLDEENGNLIRQNSQRWANTANIELLNEELYEILPRYAPRNEPEAPSDFQEDQG